MPMFIPVAFAWFSSFTKKRANHSRQTWVQFCQFFYFTAAHSHEESAQAVKVWVSIACGGKTEILWVSAKCERGKGIGRQLFLFFLVVVFGP